MQARLLVLFTLIALTSGFLWLLRRENERSPRTGVPSWQNRNLPGRSLAIAAWVVVIVGSLLAALNASAQAGDPFLVAAIASTALLVMALVATLLGRWRR